MPAGLPSAACCGMGCRMWRAAAAGAPALSGSSELDGKSALGRFWLDTATPEPSSGLGLQLSPPAPAGTGLQLMGARGLLVPVAAAEGSPRGCFRLSPLRPLSRPPALAERGRPGGMAAAVESTAPPAAPAAAPAGKGMLDACTASMLGGLVELAACTDAPTGASPHLASSAGVGPLRESSSQRVHAQMPELLSNGQLLHVMQRGGGFSEGAQLWMHAMGTLWRPCLFAGVAAARAPRRRVGSPVRENQVQE